MFGNNFSFLHLPLNNSEKEIETLKNAIKQKDEELMNILSRLSEMEKNIESLLKNKANSMDKSAKSESINNDLENFTLHQEKHHESSYEITSN